MYLQDILGYCHLIPIFWTLCYEFQFDLNFVGILVLGHLSTRWLGRRTGTAILVAEFAALFIASVAAHHSWIPAVHRGVALHRWFEFFTGVVTWWVVSGVIPMMTLPAMSAGA